MESIKEVIKENILIRCNECNIRIPNICMLAMQDSDNKYLFKDRKEHKIYGIKVLKGVCHSTR